MQIATFPSVECRVLRIFEVHLQCRLFFQSQLLSGCWRILSTLGLVEVCRSVLGHQGRSARGQTLPKNPSKQSKQQGGEKKSSNTKELGESSVFTVHEHVKVLVAPGFPLRWMAPGMGGTVLAGGRTGQSWVNFHLSPRRWQRSWVVKNQYLGARREIFPTSN